MKTISMKTTVHHLITPMPFGTTIDSRIAELTRTIAAQSGEPGATLTLFQRVAVPHRLKTSVTTHCVNVSACSCAESDKTVFYE